MAAQPPASNIVLLPGLDGTGRLFDPLLAHLPSALVPHVVAYPTDVVLDWEGLVESAAKRAPCEKPCAIVAESFSGPVALRLVDRLEVKPIAVILCASFVTNPIPAWTRLVRILLAAGGCSWPVPRAMIWRFMLDGNASDELVDAVCRAIREVNPTVLASRLRMILDLDACSAIQSCGVPLLYLRGARDRLVGQRASEEMMHLKPEMNIVELNAPHLLLQCDPAGAAREIVRLVAGVGGA